MAKAAELAVVKVHGHPLSSPTRRVMACLYEKELDFEFVQVDMMSGEHKKEPFLSLNIPAFEDGDLALFESRAITQHIARTHATSGTDLIFQRNRRKTSALVVWMEVEGQKFDPAATRLIYEFLSKKLIYGKGGPDEAVVNEHEEKLAKVLDVYEDRLGKHEFLSGDAFGLADLHHISHIHYLMGTPTRKLFEERPCVAMWVAGLLGRPSWKKVLAFTDDDNIIWKTLWP